MKKMFIVMFAIISMIMVMSEQVHAAYPSGSSVGASLGGGTGVSGIAVTGQFDGFPMMLGASFGFWGGGFALNVTGDWWGFQKEIGRAGEADVLMYLGPGASLSLGIGSIFSADLGIRMPIGFSWMVDKPDWKKWEIFTEAVVGANLVGFYTSEYYTGVTVLGMHFIDGIEPTFNFLRAINLGVNVGFRHWF